MENYATTTSLQAMMVGITFDTATTALASKCITHAEDRIRMCLSRRYDISGWTAGTVPPAVLSMSEEFATGLVYKHMSRGSKESLIRAKDIIQPILDQLSDICKRNLDLYDSNGAIVPDLSTGAYYTKSTTDNYHTVFDLDSPLNWAVDSDQLDDIDDERN